MKKGYIFFNIQPETGYYNINDDSLGGDGLISLEKFVNEENFDNIKSLFEQILVSNPKVSYNIKAKKLLIEFLKRYLHTFIEKMNAWEEKEKKKRLYT